MKRLVWPQYLVEPQYIEGVLLKELDDLINLSCLRADYPELMHPGSQGARVEAQDLGSPSLPIYAPFCFRKDLKDLVSLRLLQSSRAG